MEHELKRLSIRSVDVAAVWKLREVQAHARLPLALLIEDGIDLLWQSYVDLGYDLADGKDG